MSASPSTDLITQLQQEMLLATRLYEVLAQELSALERLDSTSIQVLALEKNRLLIALDEQCERRERHYPDVFSAQHLQRYCQAQSGATQQALLRLVDEYRALLRHCQTQNEINGRIIAINRRSVDRQLSLMRGARPDATLYNARGGTLRVDGRQRFAIA